VVARRGRARAGGVCALRWRFALAWQPLDVPGRHPPVASTRFAGAVMANEYLHALPVHRLAVRAGRLRETWVTWLDDTFAWLEGDPSSEGLADSLASAVRPL